MSDCLGARKASAARAARHRTRKTSPDASHLVADPYGSAFSLAERFKYKELSCDDLVGAGVDEGWARESVAKFGEVTGEREVGEATVVASPRRDGDAEGCAGA